MMKLVLDPYYEELGFLVAQRGGFPVINVEYKEFPDGEMYLRIVDSVENEDIAIVMSGYPYQDRAILRAELYVGTLKDLGARNVYLIFSYLPYARQDKRFLSGECVTAKEIIKHMIYAGADEVITLDVHSEDVYKVFGSKFKNLKSKTLWVNYARKYGDDIFFVSPDKGRENVIKEIAQEVGAPYISFYKERDLKTGKIVKIVPEDERKLIELAEHKKVAFLFDDIISTGGTASRVVKALRKFFRKKVITAFTHGLFLRGSVRKLLDAKTDIIVATNTVRNIFAFVDASEVFVRYLRSKS